MLMYALQHIETGKLMAFHTHSMSGDFCGDTATHLTEHGDRLWMVKDRLTAYRAANNDVPSYNAEHDTPGNRYVGKLRVVTLLLSPQPDSPDFTTHERLQAICNMSADTAQKFVPMVEHAAETNTEITFDQVHKHNVLCPSDSLVGQLNHVAQIVRAN